MGVLKELREAVPLAEALQEAVDRTTEGLRSAAEAASLLKLPTPAAEAATQTPLPTGSSGGAAAGGGGSSGAGGGLIAGPRQIRSVDRKLIKPEDWLAAKCQRTTFQIPNPRNPNAVAQGDIVTVGGWDCSAELHMEADFYDPDDMERLRGVQKLSISSTGGGKGSGGGGGGSPRGIEFNEHELAGGRHRLGAGSVEAQPPTKPSGPVQVTDPAMAEQTRLLREIRDQGRQDAGLGRRVGGRP